MKEEEKRKKKDSGDIKKENASPEVTQISDASTSSQVNYSILEEKSQIFKETEEHLRLLFEDYDNGYFEIRRFYKKGEISEAEAKKTQGIKERKFYEINAVNFEKASRYFSTKDEVFVGAFARKKESGKNEDVEKVIYLYVDFDPIDRTKETITLEELLFELRILNLEPRFIVYSGYGFHVYFKLEEFVSAGEFIKYQLALLSYLRRFINKDNLKIDDIKDLARVLRLAGTYNEKQNEHKLTKIVYKNEHATIKLDFLEHLIRTQELEKNEVIKHFERTNVKHELNKKEIEQVLKEEVTKIFYEGQRQFSTMYLAGFMAKLGFSEDETIEFYEKYLIDIDDEKDYHQRIAAIKRTYKLFVEGKPIAGASGLIALGCNLDKLSIKPVKVQDDKWKIRDNILYYNDSPIAPAVEILGFLIYQDELRRNVILKFDNLTRTDLKLNKDDIVAFTGIPVVEQKRFNMYLMQKIKEVEKEKKYYYSIKRTGWYEDKFIMFDNTKARDNFFYEADSETLSRFVIREKDKQHQLVKYSLENATELGIAYVLALSSIFLKPFNLGGFTVFVTGARAKGKTTLCKLATNLFYDSRKHFTLDATDTALEMLAYTYSDLPLLFDELGLSSDIEKAERLILRTEASTSRARSNKSLTVKKFDLRNVVFVTSETNPRLKRQGAERRRIILNLLERAPLIDNVEVCLKWVGAGRDYIDYLVNNTDFLEEVKSEIETLNHYYEKSIIASLRLLEKYYNTNFSKIENRILELFERQEQQLGDYFERSMKLITEYIAMRRAKFYECTLHELQDDEALKEAIEREKNRQKQEALGIIVYEDENKKRYKVYFYTEAFNKILEELSLEKDTVLTEARKHKILISNEKDKNYYKVSETTNIYRNMKKLLGASARSRYILFEINEDDLISNEEVTDEINEEEEEKVITFDELEELDL